MVCIKWLPVIGMAVLCSFCGCGGPAPEPKQTTGITRPPPEPARSKKTTKPQQTPSEVLAAIIQDQPDKASIRGAKIAQGVVTVQYDVGLPMDASEGRSFITLLMESLCPRVFEDIPESSRISLVVYGFTSRGQAVRMMRKDRRANTVVCRMSMSRSTYHKYSDWESLEDKLLRELPRRADSCWFHKSLRM